MIYSELNIKLTYHCEDQIRKELTPAEKWTTNVKELREELLDIDSICLTIRRGDFCSDAHSNRYKVCDESYYYRAVNYITSKIENSVILVCSDDLNWCRKNIDFPNNRVIFEPDGLTIPEKLSLMSACRHFVLSNSSFSWWAQFLSSNKGIVVAPHVWRTEIFKPKDVYEKSWVRI